MFRSTAARIGLVTRCSLMRLSPIGIGSASRPKILAARAQPRTITMTAHCRRAADTSKRNPPHARRSGPHPVALLAVLLSGSAAYFVLVKTRENPSKKQNELPKGASPRFDKDEVAVLFVIGGPGSGKGTQCKNIANDYGFTHLSAGDLLRAERNRPGSKYGDLINTCMKEGKIVPIGITIALLEQAMLNDGGKKFVIDGFPVKMEQAIKFENEVVEARLVIYLECPENVMLERLLKRGETSGRVDDNVETILKRFKTFVENSYPIVEYYKKRGKISSILCVNPPNVVYQDMKKILNKDLFSENRVI